MLGWAWVTRGWVVATDSLSQGIRKDMEGGTMHEARLQDLGVRSIVPPDFPFITKIQR